MKSKITLFNKLKDKARYLVSRLKLKRRETQKTGRPKIIGMMDAISFGLFQHTTNIPTKKKTREVLEPNGSYETFVRNVNRWGKEAAIILAILLKANRKETSPVKITDGTDIPLCMNKNVRHHKTMEGLANWGKTGKGWFYGLKLRFTVDFRGDVLAFRFTSGNVHDSAIFMRLNKGLRGIFLADAAYARDKLAREFYETTGNILLAAQRRNMKKLAALWQNELYKFRMRIEWSFRSLKLFHGLVTSLPRSVNGCFSNYSYAILAYTFG